MLTVTDKCTEKRRSDNCGKHFDEIFNNALSVVKTETNTYNSELNLSYKDIELLLGVSKS